MRTKFMDSTRACILHYGQSLPVGGNSGKEARQPMAQFVETSDRQIYRWTRLESSPRGEDLIRVRFWLESQGYKVSELQELADEVYLLASLLAFSVFDFALVHEMITGYTNPDDSMALLHGTCPLSSAKRQKIKDFLDDYLVAQIERLQPWLHWMESFTEVVWPSLEAQPTVKPLSTDNHDVILQSLKGMIEAASPLAELVLSDEFTQEERRALRQSFNDDELFVFSNTLSALCSAKAREEALKEKRGGR